MTRPPRVNYDQIAPLYDSQPYRARTVDPEFLMFIRTVRRRDVCSQLQAIDDDAYVAGVRRLEREVAAAATPLVRQDHLCMATFRGDRPTGS